MSNISNRVIPSTKNLKENFVNVLPHNLVLKNRNLLIKCVVVQLMWNNFYTKKELSRIIELTQNN